MDAPPPRLFDRALHRARLDRAARRFPDADFLKRRAAENAADRLSNILRDFPVAVDLSARTGVFREALSGTPAQARIGALLEADLSRPMLGDRHGLRVVIDEERLPFAAGSVNLFVSLLSLHWTNDLVGALTQIRRALAADGLFVGALFGGSTLTELRQSLLEAESEISGGAGLRVSPFADGFDAAGLLQRAGFALPVSDVDRLVVRYDHPLKLMADLRAMGETNILIDRPRAPMSRRVLARAFQIYAERFSDPDGRVRATFEIITATGWAPDPSQQKPLRRGSAKMRLADALASSSTGWTRREAAHRRGEELGEERLRPCRRSRPGASRPASAGAHGGDPGLDGGAARRLAGGFRARTCGRTGLADPRADPRVAIPDARRPHGHELGEGGGDRRVMAKGRRAMTIATRSNGIA